MSGRVEFPYLHNVCKLGMGSECCRYITVGKDGFMCEKNGPLREALDARAENMVARGDNCDGREWEKTVTLADIVLGR